MKKPPPADKPGAANTSTRKDKFQMDSFSISGLTRKVKRMAVTAPLLVGAWALVGLLQGEAVCAFVLAGAVIAENAACGWMGVQK